MGKIPSLFLKLQYRFFAEYSKNMDENNQYYQCFRVMFQVLKILGIFPFLFSHQGTSKNLFVSRVITLISTVFFCVAWGENYFYVIQNANLMFVNFQYNIFVGIIPPVINRIMFLLIPLMTWRSHKRVYSHMEKWQNLQDTLCGIQKSPFSLPFKNTIPYTTIVILIGTAFMFIPLKPYFDVNIAASTRILSFLFLAETVMSVALYWLTNCLFVALVARNIRALINKSITNKDEDSLMKLVEFWVKLYDWNAEFTSTASVTFLITILNMILTMVTCFYAFTFLIFVEEDRRASLAYFTCAMISFAILLIFCESANLVLEQVARLTHGTLLTTNTKGMNPRILKVILIFIQTIETKQPKIMVNGMMIINRSSVISICATIINFLIVLKQFNPLG